MGVVDALNIAIFLNSRLEGENIKVSSVSSFSNAVDFSLVFSKKKNS